MEQTTVTTLEHGTGLVATYIDTFNVWLGVEIQLLLPVAVIIGLTDAFLSKRPKLYSDSLLAALAFVCGLTLQAAFGDHSEPQALLKSALYMGSLSAFYHFSVREHVYSFFGKFMPWLMDVSLVSFKAKVMAILGVEKGDLSSEGDQ